MTEIRTMARPYARGVFDIARQDNNLQAWSDGLGAVAAIVANDDVHRLIGNPVIADDALTEAIIAIAGDDLPKQGNAYVRVLVDNGRLTLAPAIAEQYEAMRAAAENRVEVTVTSAAAFSDEQKQELGQALQARLAARTELAFEQDENIIGGAIIRAGDLVIDRSVRSQLDRMQRQLTQ